MKMKKLKFFTAFILLGFAMNSCTNNDSATYPVAINMTDAPGPYQKVNIDLQGVEITGSDGKTVTTNVKNGIYNLLDFTNGVSTLIATGDLEVATISQIRLILGPNNTVVIGGVSYPLSTPSAEQSGLKLQVNYKLQANVLYQITLDFDAYKSIVDLGNGGYKLKPVIRTVETAIGGSIKGKISPIGLAIVTAVNTADSTLSYSTSVNSSGDFTVVGIPAGNYNVTVTPVLPLLPAVKTSVVVTSGVVTNIGTVTIM